MIRVGTQGMTYPAAQISKRLLLSIIELGGYPDFKPLYRQAGYEVESVASVRKALGLLKKLSPDVIVAEFEKRLGIEKQDVGVEDERFAQRSLPWRFCR